MSNSENSKRIVKNTGMLYIRMLLTMGITLYTSRIILSTLGVEDFGIYNVVGGVVIMAGFLNSSMATATQRFLSFELGRKDDRQLAKVFNVSLMIHVVIGVFILILTETIGLWAVNTQLTIPSDRLVAANWVYQFSVLSFMVTIIGVPYYAVIIAHERMKVYAWIGTVEVFLKLLIVFLLQSFGFDKLTTYAILIFIVTFIIRLAYGFYCKRNFKETRLKFIWDKVLFKTMMSHAGWNMWGNAAGVIYGQGVNILLNIFFGPVVNAARGIAFQVKSAMSGFVSNFQLAMNPQLVKSFAENNLTYMHQIIFQGAKFSFFLLLLFCIPIIMETELILSIWLKEVPEHTVIFTRLALINIMIDSLSGTMVGAVQASGKIKLYQSLVGGLLLLILPISYLFLKIGFPAEVTLYVSIIISIIAMFLRVILLEKLIDISIKKFISKVIFISFIVSILSFVMPLIPRLIMNTGIFRFLTVSIVAIISTICSIYFIGLNTIEKEYIRSRIKFKI
ncbi:oligosaccharide flippase family protein [Polaribacter sp. Z014]|uniref:oligosaccharide flippase family protein n=1 Tax=Polaribacter sp. Z014 TaxID=2927126 RepID=UPI0020213935|nr:oligosaccharide flippase family protein [Polaribacter sp. Z014]MCL7763387.1 oligosaccharide flippase family protein [Polaribacter sp. Z014]